MTKRRTSLIAGGAFLAGMLVAGTLAFATSSASEPPGTSHILTVTLRTSHAGVPCTERGSDTDAFSLMTPANGEVSDYIAYPKSVSWSETEVYCSIHITFKVTPAMGTFDIVNELSGKRWSTSYERVQANGFEYYGGVY